MSTITIDPADLAGTLKSLVEQLPKSTLNMYRWVLEHGVKFAAASLPANIPAGVPKECYNNCYRLMLRRQTVQRDLIYCEGYAMGLIPVLHAWFVTQDGKVVDPTWKGGQFPPWSERSYFGIPFQTKYVLACIGRDSVPLLDNWQAGFPILKADPETWRHPKWRS